MEFKYFQRRKLLEIKEKSKVFKEPTQKERKGYFLSFKISSVFVLMYLIVFLLNGNVFAPVFETSSVFAGYDEERAKLEKELQEIEAQIAQYEKVLAQTQKEKQTLQNKINELKKKAEKISLQIKETNLNLKYLNVQIEETTSSIVKLNQEIEKKKENLINLLQLYYQIQNQSTIQILLATNQISDFFNHLNALNSFQEKIQSNIEELKILNATLSQKKQNLDENLEETQKILSMQLLQKSELETTKKEQENLLAITKGNEQTYQKLLEESRRRANEIRNRIYNLLGIKTQVTFGEALEIAEWVSAKTGVRPALILAVLTQESNLGKNVGTCNREGDPPSKSWQKVMRPDNREAFYQITKELGLNPDTTPISCPIHNPSKGLIAGKNSWGGAMGPAQFMPNTWLKYKDRVSQITGKSPANPWDIRDAFVACALYLADWGATQKTRNAEWRAAMIYFSGSTNPRYRFYGDSVMALADKYQQDIDYLKQVAQNK
ncbi:MAG: lytic murein transglycosylase [Candidatus Paceibacterota bacterium]